MTDTQPYARSTFLLDVLDMLPLDVVQQNIWELLPLQACSSFRRSCKQGRSLADQLTVHAGLKFGHMPSTWPGDSGVEGWHMVAYRQVAYLAGLSNLETLTLSQVAEEEALIYVLVRCNEATCGHVRKLIIRAGASKRPYDGRYPTLGAATGSAVLGACPRLQHLSLLSDVDPFSKAGIQNNLFLALNYLNGLPLTHVSYRMSRR